MAVAAVQAPLARKSAASRSGWQSSPDLMHQLVRRLIQEARTPDASAANTAEQGVLLDICVEGVRCVLSEAPPELSLPSQIPLSPREIEIARMVAKGLPNKTIAAVLDISTWTVGTYMRRAFAKLGVSSRAALVGKMAALGIIRTSE